MKHGESNVNRILSLVLATGGFVALAGYFAMSGNTAAQAAVDSQTQAVVTAANAFLNTLTADQRQKVQFPFSPQKTASAAKFSRSGPAGRPVGTPPPQSPQGRDHGGPLGQGPGGGPGMGPPGGFVGEKYGDAVWSNYPVSDVPRPGLQIGSLSAGQRTAAMHLLQVLLSPGGYQKVLEIMGSDQALADSGTPFASGSAVYTIGIFGSPSATSPWMLQFGGHHLGLNIVIAGEHGVGTPNLTGAQPAVYTAGGKTVRVLAAENDKAFALLDALDDSQRKQATLNYRVGDLVLGPGQAGKVIQPEGLKASAMNDKQRALLLDVISQWVGIVNDAYTAPRLAEIKAGLEDTYFAWSGPATHEPGKNGSSYYRIQGPRLVIEFSPQGVGGDPTMHVHTIYRDPTNDYGVRFTLPQ
jgi:Protein of unknown function (DUF3500)